MALRFALPNYRKHWNHRCSIHSDFRALTELSALQFLKLLPDVASRAGAATILACAAGDAWHCSG
jgi:hypothetical protein